MIQLIQNAFRQLWHRLLRLAHHRPWISGLVVIAVLMLVSGLMGWAMRGLEESLVKWLDNAFIVLGGLSLSVGWAVALVVYAGRKDAALNFRHAGTDIQCPDFKAALILASNREELMEWHLRHIPHERVECVWTAFTRDATANVMQRFPRLRSLHAPNQRPDAADCKDDPDCLDDPFDLIAVKAHCRALLLELLARYDPGQICVNITGSTAVMTLGAFQAAEELRITSLYLLGTHRDERGNPSIRRSHVGESSEGQIKLISDHSAESGAGTAAPEETAP
ncbi:MAG TPA: hypothetical protein DDY14_00920 [Chromatiaceae bacterium]|jgi:hypothetical protein|nr:MAG: hypothetical protein N838_04820 [Thiohalocapsa sp. PB-PSB1]QQO56049.1 MAG: hypothetical protein N838_24545 [Thiohalocapsa sp. PB-PSB1]HBG93895.1 hypothetical protein [Chromatiaceae bacterium]HCS91940.1 hypothetical protein [Chromatiaceae bacterium]